MTEPTVTFIPPKSHRIPPRGEAVLRFVNDLILHNLRDEGAITEIILPSLIERAYMVVNETSTIEFRNYPAGVTTRAKQ